MSRKYGSNLPCFAAGKPRFKKRKQALTNAAQVAAYEGRDLYVYKCPHCREWHLTSSPQKKS